MSEDKHRFHKESGELLGGFKDWCMSFGGVAAAFLVMDPQRNNFLTLDTWIAALESNGFGEKFPENKDWDSTTIRRNCEILYTSFDLENHGYLTASDIMFLEAIRILACT